MYIAWAERCQGVSNGFSSSHESKLSKTFCLSFAIEAIFQTSSVLVDLSFNRFFFLWFEKRDEGVDNFFSRTIYLSEFQVDKLLCVVMLIA